MELREILKKEHSFLKRCDRALTNVKVFRLSNLEQSVTIDLTNKENKDLEQRLYLRQKISTLNKKVNQSLVGMLSNAGYNVEDYMKGLWNQIIKGFASLADNYNKAEFSRKFLSDKNSPLYRRFPDSLTLQTMESYIKYLKLYLYDFYYLGHKSSIEKARATLSSQNVKIVHSDTLLPKNWSDLYKLIKELSDRASAKDEAQSSKQPSSAYSTEDERE